MIAAVFEGDGRLSITERPAPSRERPDDVLIEVEACGICGTDVHILDVPPGHPATPGVIMGHEFVGIVREPGPEAIGVERGRRVAVAANLSCGSCSWCKRGVPSHCDHFSTMGIFRDGGLASFAVAPAPACHEVSGDLPREIAALTEPLSCVVNGVEQAQLLPGESAVVIGAGPIGLLFLALFRAAGASSVIVVETMELRRDAAKRMGAEVCQYDITRNELTVFGTYVGTDVFPKAARILESGVVDLSPMITHRVPVEDLPRALDAMRTGEAVKVVIDLKAGT